MLSGGILIDDSQVTLTEHRRIRSSGSARVGIVGPAAIHDHIRGHAIDQRAAHAGQPICSLNGSIYRIARNTMRVSSGVPLAAESGGCYRLTINCSIR